MSRIHNNDDMPVLPVISSIPFFVGNKEFGWSLIFMGEETISGTLELCARIHLYGTRETFYDSNEIEVDIYDTLVPQVTFDAASFKESGLLESCSSTDYYGRLENNCTAKIQVLKNNGMYMIQVSDLDLTVKWVVGARHIVLVDPKFPGQTISASSADNKLSEINGHIREIVHV